MFTPSDPAKSPNGQNKTSRKELRYVFIMILVLIFMCFVIATQVFQKTEDKTSQVSAKVRPPEGSLKPGPLSGISTSEAEEDLEPPSGPEAPPKPPTPFVEDLQIWTKVDDNKIGDKLETEPFYYLMHMINSMNQSEIIKRAEADKISLENIARSPEDCRGKFITFQGGYVLERRSLADKDNPSGVAVFWEGFVFNARANMFFTVFFIEKPIAFDWNPHAGPKDVVKVSGVFMKKHHFYNKNNKISHNYVIFARRLEEGKDAELGSTWGSPILWTAGALVFIIIIVLVIILRREARKSAESEQAFKARHRKKIDNEFTRAKVINPDAIKKGKDKPEPPPDS
ncbi:MAG: hypothetical protein E3J72_18350 [Planctomycetota bacterium]|nr:MAG: hypothetical protein E3J72_18350 [Planctomycetota bacterium]